MHQKQTKKTKQKISHLFTRLFISKNETHKKHTNTRLLQILVHVNVCISAATHRFALSVIYVLQIVNDTNLIKLRAIEIHSNMNWVFRNSIHFHFVKQYCLCRSQKMDYYDQQLRVCASVEYGHAACESMHPRAHIKHTVVN